MQQHSSGAKLQHERLKWDEPGLIELTRARKRARGNCGTGSGDADYCELGSNASNWGCRIGNSASNDGCWSGNSASGDGCFGPGNSASGTCSSGT